MRLIRMWMAEGFIQIKQGIKSLEEIGESYFFELLNRRLFQIEGITADGRVDTCRVHDLIREIIISKARDQNFGSIVVAGDAKDTIMVDKRIRRLSIHNGCEKIIIAQEAESFIHLRSLFMFRVDTLSNTFRSAFFFSRPKLLKVLDLRGAPLEEFPEEFTNCFHLRYLSVRNTKIKENPDSMKKLQNLETLDLKKTYVSELPVGILNLYKLRHLLVYYPYNFD
uniref:Disease resistance protein RPM1-like n=1 Tax=Nelumbo nucifera TaxID=4432 RepID=A0A822ZE19_NELNU|nr:TPA_asm: hypothetical protein HUJ06_001053 [Nelumbo nucifera]